MIPALRRLYRLLLHICPRAVRREYAREMEEVFAHCLATEWGRAGLPGRVIAAANGLRDLMWFAARAHWHSWGSPAARMNRTLGRSRAVIVRDFRRALRILRTQPASSAGIVLMLALGIGSTTAIATVVYGVLLRPLPFPDPDRLVQIYGTRPDRGWATVSLTEADVWDLRDLTRTFEEIGAMQSAGFSLTGFDPPERVTGGVASAGFFRALGVRPVAGRLFEPGDDAPGQDGSIAVLSHGLWLRRFGADPSAVGRSITLDGRPYTIVGALPAGSPWLDEVDLFVPFVRRLDANRSSFEYTAIGRLRPGVAIDAASADLQRVARQLQAAHPESNADLTYTLAPSTTWVASGELRRALWILFGAVTLLLVIACANVTNLLLARNSVRTRESAVRAALGASRADIISERLMESLMYSTLAAAAGFLLAGWMLDGLESSYPGEVPRLGEVGLQPSVLIFSVALALAVGVATGLLPALRTPFTNIVASLRPSGRGSGGSRDRTRRVFVTAQVMISVALLVGASLLARSLVNVLSVDRGFRTDNRLLATLSIPRSLAGERIVQIADEILARLQTAPGVAAAAAVSGRPLSRGSTGMGIGAADQPDAPGAAVPWATWRLVTPEYFKVMGLPVLAGRGFTAHDRIGKPWQAVISRRLADVLWPGRDPIGRTAILWKGQSNYPAEVIGVVGDMRERGLEDDPTLAVYFPATGEAMTSLQLVIHASGRPEQAVAAVRTSVAGVDPHLPISNIATFEDLVSVSVAARRLTVVLLAAFATMAFFLALAGVYGVLAYSIARRIPEMGVRLALGADHRSLLRLVVGQGMRPVLFGTVLGLLASYGLAQLMSSLLFGIAARDASTFAAVAIAVLAIALLACYLPARSVLSLDPSVALRTE